MLRNAKYLMSLSRSYHSTAALTSKRNVGLRHRVKIAKNDTKAAVEILEDDPGEYFSCILKYFPLTFLCPLEFDPDSDFFEADTSHRHHQKEMDEYKEKLRHWIVRDKYFKRKSPNFLTWAEKEHIRHLHQEDPDEWSIEHLCESFPIEIHHIKKLLKNKWAPRDAKRVEKHDLAVKENWEKFRNGEFDEELDPKVRMHLMKFKDRKINLQALPKFEPKLKLSENIKTKNDEFLRIITSCKKYQEIEAAESQSQEDVKQISSSNESSTESPDFQTMMSEKGFNPRRRMTLSELKWLLGEKETDNEPIEIDEKQLELHSKQNPAGTGIVQKQHRPKFDSIDFPKKYNVQVATQKELDTMKITPVKENIRIPRKLWRKNATYKYKDCFYDDDGELLYRVPGLTK